MIIILLIYLVIGLFIYLSEKKSIDEDEDELEIYDELEDKEKVLYFIFTVILWGPILVTYYFTNFFDNFSE